MTNCPNCLMPETVLTPSGIRIHMVQDLNLRPSKRKCEHTVSRVHAEFITHSGAAKAIRWRPEETDRFRSLDELAVFKPFRIWQQEIDGMIFTDEDD